MKTKNSVPNGKNKHLLGREGHRRIWGLKFWVKSFLLRRWKEREHLEAEAEGGVTWQAWERLSLKGIRVVVVVLLKIEVQTSYPIVVRLLLKREEGNGSHSHYTLHFSVQFATAEQRRTRASFAESSSRLSNTNFQALCFFFFFVGAVERNNSKHFYRGKWKE